MSYRTRTPLAAGILSGSTLSSGPLGSLGVGDWTDDFSDWVSNATSSGGGGGDTSGGGVIEGRPETGWVDPRAGKPCGINSIFNTSGECIEMSAHQPGECPAGFWYDNIQKTCIPACKNTEVLDPNTGNCVPYCEPPLIWGGGSKGCISQADWNKLPSGWADCPAGTTFDKAKNVCVDKKSGTTTPVAPKPQPKPPAPAPPKQSSGPSPLLLGLGALAVGVGIMVAVKHHQKKKGLDHAALVSPGAGRRAQASAKAPRPAFSLTEEATVMFHPAMRQGYVQLSGDDTDSPSVDEVVQKRDAAAQALRQYEPGLEMDEGKASAAVRDAEVWFNDHQGALDAFLSSAGPNDRTPDDIVLQMPQDEAKQFILGSYWYGSHGMGVYTSGYSNELALKGEAPWSFSFIDADLRKRRQLFQAILTLEQHGTLAQIFAKQTTSGLGITWLGALIIIGIVAVVLAAVVHLVLSLKDQKQRWGVFEKACQQARADGNQKAMEECLRMGAPKAPVDPMEQGIWAACIVAVAYIALVFALPKLVEAVKRPASSGAVE